MTRAEAEANVTMDDRSTGQSAERGYCPICFVELQPDPLPERMAICLHAWRYSGASLGLEGGEGGDAVAAEDVERDARREVLVGIEGDFVCAFARVGDLWGYWGVGGGDLDGEGEVEGEREADDVESGADVG